MTLTATPSSGSAFGGWSGACSGTGSCAVTMSSSQAVTASFNPSVAPTITIGISPAAATIQTGGTQHFTATVIGATNTAANWSVNGVAGGNPSAGTISSSGLYTAPASVPSSNTVTIAATSVANPSAAASAMLLINPACQVPAAAMTDANGTATLCAGGFVFPIQLTDVDSGQPLASGLAVSAAVDPALPGRAIVLIADPAQNYPLQFVLLDSPPPAGATAARREAAADRQAQASGSTIAVPAQSGTAAVLTGVIQALQTGLLAGALPAPKPNTQSFTNTFLTVVQEMTSSSQVLLPPPLSGALPSVTTSSPVPIGEYRQALATQVGADAAQNLSTWYITLPADEEITLVGSLSDLYGGLAAAVTVDIMDDVLATYYQEIGASSVVTETIRFGGIAVQIPLPDFTAPIQNIIPPKPNLNITVQAPNGSAVSKGSVQLVSGGDLGFGMLGNVGGNGLAAIPAPPGPYTARVDSLGFQPQTQNVTVPALGGTSLSFVLQFLPQPLALSFNPVTPVPAMLGMPYLFSFCSPPLTNPAQLCEVPPATNPSGGQPPYRFQLATLGGFPPMGISLSLNGLLTGTAKAAGTANFQVCAVDLSGASVCQPVSLTVDPVLTITTSGNGTVGSSPQGTPCGSGCFGFAPETVVTLTATPNTGSTFTGWSGACSGTGLCTVTMGSSQTVTATFSGAAGGMTLVSNTPFTCVATSGFGMNCSGSVTTNISLPMAAGTALAVIVSSSIDGSFFPSASVTTTQSPPGTPTFPIQAGVLSCPAAQTDLDLYQVIDGVVTGPSLASVSGLNISFACP